MDLTEEFQRFVGAIVKDPMRMTADGDTAEGVELADEARKHGLHVVFSKVGEPEEPFMGDVEALFVTLTKDGVADDQKGWGWRVLGLNVG